MDVTLKRSISRRELLKFGGTALGVSALTACSGISKIPSIPPPSVPSLVPSGGVATNWLSAAQWGVFNQGQMAEIQVPPITTVAAWNAYVNAFDTDGVANQLQRMGAGYLLHGLGQNSGFYSSPNAAFDSYVGESPSTCSTSRSGCGSLYVTQRARHRFDGLPAIRSARSRLSG